MLQGRALGLQEASLRVNVLAMAANLRLQDHCMQVLVLKAYSLTGSHVIACRTPPSSSRMPQPAVA